MLDLLQAIHRFFIDPVLMLVAILIFVWVIVGWLITFNVINTRNPQARQMVYGLNSIVDPMMRPFRRLIPPLGGTIDLAPLAFILLLFFVKDWLMLKIFYVWLPAIF
jgi:YggT family protein